MANKLILKNGAGVPAPEKLEVAELALDTQDGSLYSKLNDGSVVQLNDGADSGGTGSSVHIGENPPSGPQEGQQWMEVPADGDATMWIWDGAVWLQQPGGKDGADGADGSGSIEDGATDGQITTWAGDKWSPNDAVIVKDGNVGIGTDSPSSSNSLSPLVEVKSSADSTPAGFRAGNLNGSSAFELFADEDKTTIDVRGGKSFTVETSNEERLHVDGATGNATFTGEVKIGTADFYTSGNTLTISESAVDGEINLRVAAQNRLTIDSNGNVGIGMTPLRSTAKEQLAEWKTKAKASTWSEVTDGEFSQEPTEEALAEWMETRGAGDKLQVNGSGSFSGPVIAGSADTSKNGVTLYHNGVVYASRDTSGDSSVWRGFGAGVETSKINSNGNATFTGSVSTPHVLESTGAVGMYFSGSLSSIYPRSSSGPANNSIDLGTSQYRFKDAHLAGTVSAEKLVSVNSNSYSGGFRATRGNGDDVTLIPVDADGTVTDGTISLGRSKVDNATNPMTWKDGFFSGTVNAGNMALSTAKIRRSDSNGSGLYFLGAMIRPIDKDGAETSGELSLGSDSAKFNDAYFAGNVHCNSVRNGEAGIEFQPRYVLPVDSKGEITTNEISLGSPPVQWKELFCVRTRSQMVIQDGAPVIDAKGLIKTLSTLRNATKDETTLEGMRDALSDAIGGIIQDLEHQISTMPAEDSNE
jgi:hypothetical protein